MIKDIEKPRFQGLKSCILICFGLIIQIPIGLLWTSFTAFKAKLQYICWIEMSTGKKYDFIFLQPKNVISRLKTCLRALY